MKYSNGDCPETDDEMYKAIDKKPKIRLMKYHKGKERLIETETLSEMIQHFSYTLECGDSWNKKINRNPKTLKSLISNINKSYDETQGGCYDRDHVSEVS